MYSSAQKPVLVFLGPARHWTLAVVLHGDHTPIAAHKVPLRGRGVVGAVDPLGGKGPVERALERVAEVAVVADHVLGEERPEELPEEALVQALGGLPVRGFDQAPEGLDHGTPVVLIQSHA